MPAVGGVGGVAAGGVCEDWTTTDLVQAFPTGAYAALTDAQIDPWVTFASEILFNLTGRRWPGECEATARPYSCSGCMSSCSCGPLSSVVLRGYPIQEIEQVRVDGVVLDADEYEIDGAQRRLIGLQRADGGGRRTWPATQRLDLEPTEVDTFEVQYVFGQAPPEAGATCAAILAGELALAASGAECRLPPEVVSLSRQGVTMEIQPGVGELAEGRTGIREVDMWVAAVRLGDRRRRGGVLDVARRKPVRRGGT